LRPADREVEQDDAEFLAGILESTVLPIDHAEAAPVHRKDVVGEEIPMTVLQVPPRLEERFKRD
jgi:hypothetical protein